MSGQTIAPSPFIRQPSMNPRRVHKLMRQSLPPVDLLAREWTNVAESSDPKIDIVKLSTGA